MFYDLHVRVMTAVTITIFFSAFSQLGEVTPHIPVTQTRSYNLYMVAEDCAPPKDNEGIMYVRKGQIYDIIESKSDWWWARLVRDLPKGSEGICQQGWVPGSFLEKYGGTLSADEKTKINSSEYIHDCACMEVCLYRACSHVMGCIMLGRLI